MPQAPQVYVDETKNRQLMMAAAALPPGQVAEARRMPRGLLSVCWPNRNGG